MTVFKKSNIPNILSVFRICLVPVFIYLFMVAEKQITAIAVFLLAGLTDVIDGILARKNNWITDVGKILDPFADKCMQIAALVCLALSRLLSWWIAGVLIFKELLLLAGGFGLLKTKRVYVQSSWYGKAGTVAFYIAVVLLVTVKDMHDTAKAGIGVVLIGFMLFALTMYFINYKKTVLIKKSTKKDSVEV